MSYCAGGLLTDFVMRDAENFKKNGESMERLGFQEVSENSWYFDGKYTDCIFEDLAQYIDGQITLLGEDGAQWKLVMKDGTLTTFKSRTIFEDEEEEFIKEKVKKKFFVSVYYSFDPTATLFMFNTYEEADSFIRESVLKEEQDGEVVTTQAEGWAQIVWDSGDFMEWRIAELEDIV